jgi:iron complex transport system substrate-binding protein
MKKKNKMLALLGIVVVLCSMLLVALPAMSIAAKQDDYVLGIYGNANEDDTIDMRDLTYVKLIFFGKKPETELADAKYDGKINPLDFIQIKLIIVGKEKELTIVDSVDRIVTVNKPIGGIVSFSGDACEALRTLNAANKVVGVIYYIKDDEVFFPELSKLPSVGSWSEPDVERIISLAPDIVVTYGGFPSLERLEDKLEGTDITVVRFYFYKPFAVSISEEITKFGYILGRREEAEEFNDFHEGVMNQIIECTEKLSEDEKPRIYIEGSFKDYKTYSEGSGTHDMVVVAGGINIAADLGGSYPIVEPEWVLWENPDIIIKTTAAKYGSGIGYGHEDPSVPQSYIDDMIAGRTGWNNLTAVINGEVYLLDTDISGSPGYFAGVAYMAKWFHHDRFSDLDPEAVYKEYLERYQGLDYCGIFAYPPPAS